MMNLTKVPAQKTVVLHAACQKPGCETQLVVLGVNVAFHAHDADTPICCASQTNSLLGDISYLSPTLSSFSLQCMYVCSQYVSLSRMKPVAINLPTCL